MRRYSDALVRRLACRVPRARPYGPKAMGQAHGLGPRAQGSPLRFIHYSEFKLNDPAKLAPPQGSSLTTLL